MALKFDDPTYDFNAICVCVSASDDGGEYEFQISLEALQDHFGLKGTGATNAIGAYRQHRVAIEAEIQRRHNNGEFERSGNFRLQSLHFHNLP